MNKKPLYLENPLKPPSTQGRRAIKILAIAVNYHLFSCVQKEAHYSSRFFWDLTDALGVVSMIR